MIHSNTLVEVKKFFLFAPTKALLVRHRENGASSGNPLLYNTLFPQRLILLLP
jgi:hypothetical protein